MSRFVLTLAAINVFIVAAGVVIAYAFGWPGWAIALAFLLPLGLFEVVTGRRAR